MRLATIIATLVLAACAAPPAPPPADESARLDEFMERVFVERLDRSPTFKTRLGMKEDNDKWTERTEAFLREGYENELGYLDELRSGFDPAALTAEARLNHQLLEYDIRERIEMYRWRNHYYALEHRSGVQSYAPAFLINTHRIDSVADARAYIARLRGMETLFEQTIGQMRVQAAMGALPPRFVFAPAIESAQNVIRGRPFDDGPDDSTLRADFAKKVAELEIDETERGALLDEADRALAEVTGPAYRNLIDHLRMLGQRATDDDGVWKLPDGEEFYAFELRRRTTTEMDARTIHELGLAEVARIHDEMREIMRQVGFDGSLAGFFEFMRNDPQFYYPNTDEGRARYLAEATAYIDDMRERLDSLFGVKPQAELVVKRVEEFRERSAGKAFYQRPAADGSRPGIYYANLYDMASMPIYQMQALAYHEGIPGHHMQIAIQQELEDLPRFRRFGSITAFSEGWGLYSEWLPVDIGAYEDPYSDFGRLAMELWRACRLVVDTGIHWKRWTRAEAIDYLRENTPNAEGDIVNAIERYIVMPGQATAYKIGMLKIQELRARSERELGERFDVRAFHDAVLRNGPVPMSVLDTLVDEHIEAVPGP